MNTSFKTFLLVVGFWGLAAASAGAGNVLTRIPPAVLPVIVFGLAFAMAALVARGRWLGEALGVLGAKGILAINLVRLIGFSFLAMSAQGRLPELFAERAGWGDIAAGAGALALLFFRDGPGFRRALFAWNIFGILDLLVAVGTAASLAFGQPDSMVLMTRLPFCLIPFWVVPLLLVMHVFLLRNASQKAGGAGPSPTGSATA